MSDDSRPPAGKMSAQAEEAILIRFDRGWQQGAAGSIRDCLGDIQGADRARLLHELIKIDLEYRWQQGETIGIESYLAEFAELGPAAGLDRELLEAEWEVRKQHRALPTVSDFAARFPGREHELVRWLAKHAPDEVSSGEVSADSASSSVNPARMDPAGIAGTRSSEHTQSIGASAEEPRTLSGRLGQYQIRGELGRGAFAVVYRAWDPRLKREVAIKLPRRELIEVPELRERTLREARAAARLQHPAIVPIYEVGEDPEGLYIVAECVEGQTLDTVAGKQPPSPEQAAHWVERIAVALDYAHQCGIVHRDVKPANIMIRSTAADEPVLMDFGLARHDDAVATLTQHGDLLGTPAFMSPEQARGDHSSLDHRSDVYSLGVVLYQLLCGKLPFVGNTASVLHRVIHEDPQRPRTDAREIPKDLETICLKAMAKEPSRRYLTAGALAEDLRRFLRREPILAKSPHLLGRVALWCRRQPALAGTIALSVVVLALVAGVSYWQVVQERNRYRTSLHRALVSDARSQIKARDTNWWNTALGNLEEAGQLPVADPDPRALRDLAVEVMSNDEPWFAPHDHWQAHPGSIHCVGLLSQNRVIVTAAADASLRFWDAGQGRALAAVEGLPSPIRQLAVHPSGAWMVTSDDAGQLAVWKPEPGSSPEPGGKFAWDHRPLDWTGGKVTTLAFAPDGRTLALGTSTHAVLLAQVVGEKVQLPARELGRHDAELLCLGWAKDGERLASGAADLTLKLWSVVAKTELGAWSTNDPPRQLLLSGREIAFRDHESLGFTVLDLQLGAMKEYVGLHTESVSHLLRTRHGWLTASRDGSLRLWDGNTRRAIARGPAREITSATMSPDQQQIIVAHRDGVLRRWRLQASPVVARVSVHHRACFVAGSQHLALADALVDLQDGLPGRRREWDVPAFTAVAALGSTHYVCGTRDGKLHRYAIRTSHAEQAISAHDQSVTHLIVGLDEQWIASASADGTVKQWRLPQLDLQRVWKPGIGEVDALAVEPTGRWLAACGRHGAVLWDLQAGEEKLVQPVWRVAHVLDRGTVAIADHVLALPRRGGAIQLFDLRGKPPFAQLKRLQGHPLGVVGLAVAADGRLVSSGRDRTLRVWNLTSGVEQQRINMRVPFANSLVCQPHGKLIGAGVGTGTIIHSFSEPNSAVSIGVELKAGAFSPDGQSLILAGDGGNTARLPLAAVPTGPGEKLLIPFEHLLVPGRHLRAPWAVTTSPDGKWVATGGHDRTVKIWNVASQRLQCSMSGHEDLVWCAAFSPDSKLLATGSFSATDEQGDIRLWEVPSGREVGRRQGHSRLVRGLAFDPRGRGLVSGASDGTVRIWNPRAEAEQVPAGRLLHTFAAAVHDLAFSPDGNYLVAACQNNQWAVWDLSQWDGSGQGIAEPKIIGELPGGVWAAAFNANGSYLATGNARGVVTLWRAPCWEPVLTLRSNLRDVRSLSFSSDNRFLAAGAYVGSGIVWDLTAIRKRLQRMQLDWE